MGEERFASASAGPQKTSELIAKQRHRFGGVTATDIFVSGSIALLRSVSAAALHVTAETTSAPVGQDLPGDSIVGGGKTHSPVLCVELHSCSRTLVRPHTMLEHDVHRWPLPK